MRHGAAHLTLPRASAVSAVCSTPSVAVGSPPPSGPSSPSSSKPWGTVIGASFIVLMATFIGVFFIAPPIAKCLSGNKDVFFMCTNAFACGAILSTAVYLILYESNHLVVFGGPEKEDSAAWGSMVMLGFLTGPIIDVRRRPHSLAAHTLSPPTRSRCPFSRVSIPH